MHDTFLLDNISKKILELVEENGINRLNKLSISVNYKSHVNEENLKAKLEESFPAIIGNWTKVIVNKGNIEDLTAIIESIEGEK